MKAAVYGAGALGTVLGAILTREGADVDLITRSADHAQAMNENGAVIEGLINETIPVHALRPEEMKETYDVILLLTKQLQNQKDARYYKQFLAENGVVCTLQNGIPEPELAEVLGEKRIIGGVVTWNAVRKGPGVAYLSPPESSLSFSVGTLSGQRTPELEQVRQLLSLMCPANIVDNLPGLRWSKLIVNAVLSCPATIIGGVCGDVTADPAWRRIGAHILHECVAVGHASGVEFVEIQGHNFAEELDFADEAQEKVSLERMPEAFAKNAPGVPSMLPDLRKGRPCEIDALNGVICRTGRARGVPTPFNDLAVQIVKEIAAGTADFSREHASRFDSLYV